MDPYCQRRHCKPLNVLFNIVFLALIWRTFFSGAFIHAVLSRAWLSCYVKTREDKQQYILSCPPVCASLCLSVCVYTQCTSSDLAAGWQQWRSECHGSRRRWCSVLSAVTVYRRWRSLQLPSRAGHSLPDLSATRRLHRVIQVQVGTHLSLQPMYCDQEVRSVPPITQNKYARGIGNYKIQPSMCVLFAVSPQQLIPQLPAAKLLPAKQQR